MACYITTSSQYLNQCWFSLLRFCDIHITLPWTLRNCAFLSIAFGTIFHYHLTTLLMHNALIEVFSVHGHSFTEQFHSEYASYYRRVAQIPQCISPKPHNAPLCNRNVRSMHISVIKQCIMGYLSNAVWELWDGSNRTMISLKLVKVVPYFLGDNVLSAAAKINVMPVAI